VTTPGLKLSELDKEKDDRRTIFTFAGKVRTLQLTNGESAGLNHKATQPLLKAS